METISITRRCRLVTGNFSLEANISTSTEAPDTVSITDGQVLTTAGLYQGNFSCAPEGGFSASTPSDADRAAIMAAIEELIAEATALGEAE